MNVSLDIPVGKWRNLTSEELDTINGLTGESTKTEEGSLIETVKTENPRRGKRPRKPKS